MDLHDVFEEQSSLIINDIKKMKEIFSMAVSIILPCNITIVMRSKYLFCIFREVAWNV